METTELLIIGAGPAGSAAAIEAGRLGIEALVVDKATFPRAKTCGDGLTAGALRHLSDLGLDRSAVPSWKPIDELVLVSPSGREHRYRFPDHEGSYAVTARRSELDSALVDLARSHGTDVAEGTALVDLDVAGSLPRAKVVDGDGNHRTIEARLVVAADGMWSPTRKMLGVDVGGYRGDWHAFRQYFRGVTDRALNDLVVWFEPDILPGYVWSFPLADGGVNVGFGIQRGHRHGIQEMKSLWAEILRRPAIAEFLGDDAEPEGPHRAWPIPARLGRLPLAYETVAFVGDAAAATDPMSGEGIGQAIETGRMIVAAYRAENGRVEAALNRYQESLRLGMMRDHAMARTLSGVLASPFRAEWTLRATDLTPWTRRNFARWLFEDYPRATVINPHRWKSSVFTTPPAQFRSTE